MESKPEGRKERQLIGLWPSIKKEFANQNSRLMVVRKMLEYGISVSRDARLYVGGMEVDYSALARDVGTDRRVVKQTATKIRSHPFLFSIFSGIRPVGTSLLQLVSSIGYSAIIIEADPRAAGVISRVTAVLAKHDVVVRQALADDPDMVEGARLTLIVEGKLEGEVVSELERLEAVKSITVRK